MTSNNKSKRNYGNRVDGPWVFGLVRQNNSILEENKMIKQNNKKEKTNLIRQKFPDDKKARHVLYKDSRKINNRETRIYQIKDDGKKTRRYKAVKRQKLVKDIQEVRMFVVDRRDAATLLPIIKRHIECGTEIHSDEWKAYKKIKHHGYSHYTVNHKENFVNPKTGKHTQLIECL